VSNRVGGGAAGAVGWRVTQEETMPSTPPTAVTEAAIFGRVWGGEQKLTPEVARYILGLKFPPEDMARMHELAVKNGRGDITPAESAELDKYIMIGDMLGILQSKARVVLKVKPTMRGQHG
jgi:hypothetical protein